MDFSEKVLELVSKIPEGKVSTYKQIAQAMGKSGSYRAVGNALRRNPMPIVIPCHRVVKSNGEIGGYSKGKKLKKKLLEDEGIPVEDGKVELEKYLFDNF